VSCSKEMVDIIIHTEYGAESSVRATVDCGVWVNDLFQVNTIDVDVDVCERTRNVTRNSYYS